MAKLIKAKVIPSKSPRIEEGEVVRIYVRSPPKGGMANKEAEKLLSEFLGKPVRLVKGFKKRTKVFAVED